MCKGPGALGILNFKLFEKEEYNALYIPFLPKMMASLFLHPISHYFYCLITTYVFIKT